MRTALVVSFAAFALVASCKKKSEDASPEATCAKIASLVGTMNDQEKARCAGNLRARPPAKRTCIATCAETSKTAYDMLDCQDECIGDTIPIVVTCEKLGSLEMDATECTNRYFSLERSQPAVYRCLSRCVRRAENKTAAGACRPACNVPPAASAR